MRLPLVAPESQLAPTVKRPRVVVAPPRPPQRVRAAARKVPEVTLLFWVIKLLTTGMGETTSDYLVFHINPYLAVALGFAGLVVALVAQFAVRRYIPWVYWFAVVMVAIFGTMAADVIHIVLGVPYLDFVGVLPRRAGGHLHGLVCERTDALHP